MMKYAGYTLAAMLLISTTAEARYVGPLLVKEASTGFVMAEYAKTQKCEIFAQKTVLTTNFGGGGQLMSVETKNQTLSGGYMQLIEKAQQTKLVAQSGAVDGPSVRYYAYRINPNDSVTRVLLYDENGGTGVIQNNPSSEALILRNVIESLCPNTLQGIGPAPVD
ncbi:hypothetical protein [Oligoflexus tunisiensis]|uniref:hypothetical protein n=1 Tax=Oligoflexus tunisiensis TaxID=708132 RepID=UPI00114D34F7|nr:hypothetical protein [Oligoflexus tunisiensis]